MPALVIPSTAQVIAERVVFLTTPGQRMRGLLGFDLPAGACAALTPARQVHTWGMRRALDMVFVDRGGRVLHLIRSLPPRRISPWIRRARTVYELPAGSLPADLAIGDQLSLRDR